MNDIFMRRAVELAQQGVGFTSPNPSVGAVIVKGDQVIAEGWHRRAGDSHAEIEAIQSVMSQSGIVSVDIEPALFRNATLYVTLEPCAHHGKTPPCVDALVKADFGKVVVGMKDPFKAVNGKGIKFLRENGLDVEVYRVDSPVSREVRAINQPFIKWATTGIPYIIMKAGISLDGKVATENLDSKWITSDAAREDARIERSRCDAVLVGAGTVLADDPELAAHGEFSDKKLLRVIVDSELILNPDLKVFRDQNVLVACSDLAKRERIELYRSSGIAVKSFGRDRVALDKMFLFLGEIGIQSVFVEGGSRIHGSLHDLALKNSNFLDEVIFYIAPRIIGSSKALSVVNGKGVEKLSTSKDFVSHSFSDIGGDIKWRGLYNFY